MIQFFCAHLRAAIFAGAWMILCVPASAEPPDRICSTGAMGHAHCVREAHRAFDTCQAMVAFSQRAKIDSAFFIRLIWQESRFDANAISPANAQGIAQFIPSTAKLRGLTDPFNPAEALEVSATYLAELSERFGNLGLAAVAYNGGENRAERFLKGVGLPRETRNYVPKITGHAAETWRDAPPKNPSFELEPDSDTMTGCLRLASKGKLSSPRPEPGSASPWGVQVAWGTSQAGAQAALERRAVQCTALSSAGPVEFVRQSSRVPGRRSILAVRLGRESRRAADLLCRDLRRAGCACAVFRNP